MKIRTASRSLVPLTLLCLLSACEGGSTPPPASHLPPPNEIAAVPLGQPAGMIDTAPSSTLSTANPYAGNPQAVAAGKFLYMKMNCAGCHAYAGKGNMGPDLTDAYWRYGGLPIQIYQSIHDGRPKGMPAWGETLPPPEIWKLVAYIQSLGGSVPVSSYREARLGTSPNEQVAPELLPAPAASRPPGSQ